MEDVTASIAATVGFHAERRPHELALEFWGRQTSWEALENLITGIAGALTREGIGAGDRVGHLGKNSDVMLALFFATARIGAVYVPLNWRLASAEIEYILEDSGAKLIFVGDEYRSQVRDGQGERTIIEMEHRAADQGLSSWLAQAAGVSLIPHAGAASDIVAQLYTSGTTGRPKGALLSNAYFIDGADMFLSHPEMAIRLQPSEMAPVSMPMFHIGGLNFCYSILYQGCGLIILDEYDPKAILRLIHDGRIALASGVPTMLQGLIEHPDAAKTDFSALRHYIYGAAPMPPSLLKQAIEVMGCGFASMYGMTEASGVAYLAPSDHDPAGNERMLSVGKPLPGIDLKIIDEQGSPVPSGVVGEIAIRSPQLLSGYWQLPEATRDAFVDGYFRTGDVAYVDADGYVFLKDRLKDMIISGGENIYSAEVEAVLYSHPEIHEVAVIGVFDARWGEVPKAIIVPVAGAQPDFAALARYVSERLARFKVPRQFEIIDVLPRNASGKVLKRELRDRTAAEG